MHRFVALLTLAVPLLGCPGGDDEVPFVTDAAVSSECARANDDGGVDIGIECNPVDGSRCDIRRNLSCVWDVALDESECRCLENEQPLGAPCGASLGTCEPGHVCIGLGSDTSRRCYKVCGVTMQEGCDPVIAADPTTAVTCAPLRLQDGTLTQTHGICFGVGVACDPFDDQCTDGEACAVVGRATACRPSGTRLAGQACDETNACAPGGVCVPLVDNQGTELGPRCYVPCRIDDPMCPAGQCVDVGLSVGLCFNG